MDTFADSEDANEMPQYVAFHQDLHNLLRQNRSSEKEIQYVLQIKTCDISIYTMDHPGLTVLNFIEKSICLKRVQQSSVIRSLGFDSKFHLLPYVVYVNSDVSGVTLDA